MREINKEEFVERCKKSVPYPLGDEALHSFYTFLEEHKETESAQRLLDLSRSKEEIFEGHPILLFDTYLIQLAFKQMCSDLPQEFYDFTFNS